MKRVSPLFTAKLRLWWMTRPPGSVRVMPCARKLAWEGSASAGWRARGEIITGPWGRARWGALHGAGGGARVGSRGRHGHSSLLLLLLQRNQGHSSLLLLLLLQRNQGHSRCGCCCCFHPTPPTLRRWLPRRWRG